MTARATDVVVVGAGLIGRSAAWRLAQAGLRVTVVDPHPAQGASRVAAGMLAPVTEVRYGEEDLTRLTVTAAGRWPAFARDLEAASDREVGYHRSGTLLVGFDADDVAVLADLHDYLRQLGLRADRLRSRACRRHEPMLSPRVRGGVLAADDHHVDPRKVLAALGIALERADVQAVAERVVGVDHDGGKVHGVVLGSGRRIAAPTVVLAAGVWSSAVAGVPPAAVPPVRPVRGEVLRLRHRDAEPVLGGTVRAVVRGRSVYLVPRGDGRVVVGATEEERGFDTAVSAGGVRRLLDDAASVVPVVDELELVSVDAGLRPGTPDNAPIVGRTEVGGLVVATGHYRNGVLLAPITAAAVTALATGGAPDDVLAVASPGRFRDRSTVDRGDPAVPAGTGGGR